MGKDIFTFDYTNKMAVSILREKAFKKGTKGLDNWIQCSKAAMICCNNMKEEDIHPGMEFETYFRAWNPAQWVVR